MHYNNAGTHIIHQKGYGDPVEIAVPVEVLDWMMENRISNYDIERLLDFHEKGKAGAIKGVPQEPATVSIDSLVGKDLRGYRIDYWFPNWEDSEWYHSSDIVGVKVDPTDPHSYQFVFTDEAERYRSLIWDEPDGYDDNEYESLRSKYCSTESYFNLSLRAGETVTLIKLEGSPE